MSHPLDNLIGAVRRRARRALLLYGLSRVVGVLLTAVLVAGVLDALLRLEDRGLRTFFSLMVLVAVGWSVWRYLWPAVSRRLSDVYLAQRIERSYPQLGERLSSAADFLRQADDDRPEAGSAALRRALVIEATDAAEQVQPAKVVQMSPAVRSAWPALAVGLVGLALVCFDPFVARFALTSLATPWRESRWPRRHELEFEHPVERLARGSAFEARLVDRRGELPAEVQIHYRIENSDGGKTEEVEAMRPLGGAMVARRDHITRPFAYRAEGGDDRNMPWIEVAVVDPPRVESVAIVLHPPAYTGWSDEPTGRRIVALTGTHASAQARATKPLTAARLKQENSPDIVCSLDDDSLGFHLDASQWAIERSGRYWFELTDREGLTGGADDAWNIQAIPDAPPSAAVERPTGNLMVTAAATVGLRIVARDDLALRSVALVYSRSDRSDQPDVTVPLRDWPEKVAPRAGSAATMGDGRREVIEYRWPLGELGLKPGVKLNFHVLAADYRPQRAVSDERRITIVSDDDVKQRLAGQQAFILGELKRILGLQRDARGLVQALAGQLKDVGRLRRQDIDQLQVAELNQRQIARGLVSPGEGVNVAIDNILAELRDNRLDSSDAQRQMARLATEIRRLGEQTLPGIDFDLTAAQKTAETSPKAPGNVAEVVPGPLAAKSLASALGRQDEVINSLEKLLGEYARWNSGREFARDVAQIRGDEARLADDVKQLGAATLGKELQELTPQQQADLRQLAQRQIELARRFESTQQRLGQASAALQATDPLAAQTMADGLQAARDRSIASQMAAGGRTVESNQIGQAIEAQTAIDQGLSEMLDILAGRREHELSRLAEKLRDAEQQLAGLRAKQHALVSRWHKAAQQPEADRQPELKQLSEAEAAIEKEIARFARQLQRLDATAAAGKAAAAGKKSTAAGRSAEQGDAAAGKGQAAGAELDLEEAEKQLAARRRQIEADLAQEQMARLEESLVGLATRQQHVIDETVRLEKLRQTAGQLTRAEAISAQQLSREQAALAGETDLLAEKLAGAEVFQTALKSAAQLMRDAAHWLEARDTGERAQSAERRALARFQQLQAALARDKPRPAKPDDQGGDEQNPKDEADGSQNLAQLKLLKLMQEDLMQRTRAAEQALAGAAPDADQARHLQALRQEQSRLADLLANFDGKPAQPAPEDDRDKLPDVRKQTPPTEQPRGEVPTSDAEKKP